MGKIILSPKILGNQFIPIVLKHANELATEKKLNKEEISKEISKAVGELEFREAIYKYFGNELKIKLTE
jgi:hypothetical protein